MCKERTKSRSMTSNCLLELMKCQKAEGERFMPSGWFHQTIALIVSGRTQSHIHHAKDVFSQRTPGLRHRDFGHKWYQEYGRLWDFTDPFPEWLKDEIRNICATCGPDAAEERMASDAHDNLDRVWDELDARERRWAEGLFAWLLYHPDLLETWAGVDVLRGRIKRTIDGEDVWEESPETAIEYRKLLRAVSKNQKHRLRDVLEAYGNPDSESSK